MLQPFVSFLARQTLTAAPMSFLIAFVAGIYLAIDGHWTMFWSLAAVATLGLMQYLGARWWIRREEDEDIRQWLAENPDATDQS